MTLAGLSLILRMVRRELPLGLRQFRVLIACIALGVGAIVAVLTLSRALNEGLTREGRVILGADAAFTLVQREATSAELALLNREGPISRVVMLRAMVRAKAPSKTAAENAQGASTLGATALGASTLGENTLGESALGEVKGVDAAYPHAGILALQGKTGPEKRPLSALLAPDETGLPGLVVDPLLTGRLGIGIGDPVEIGAARFRIAAHLVSEPDKLSGGIGFGPRVIMARAALEATGLNQPGALIRFQYRLDLGAKASERAVESALKRIEAGAADAGWQVTSRLKASPQLQRQIDRFVEFLTLVGLTALLIGGVGIANATQSFAQSQVMRIATLKSLGASRSFVFLSAMAQVMSFAMLGIALGLIAGVALPLIAIALFGDLLPFPLAPGVYGTELLLGLAYGVAATLLFSILPLARAKAIEASLLFRDSYGLTKYRPSLGDVAMLALALAAFVALAVVFAADRRIATYYLVAAALAIGLLRFAAMLIMRLARALPHPHQPALRLALANLHRPGSLAPSVLLSFGLGLSLLVALSLIDVNMSRQFRAALPGIAPNFFFIDIPAAEMDRFEGFVKTLAPQGKAERVPQLRGRITEVKGRPVAEVIAAEKIAWALEGDRGITYAKDVPPGSTLSAGAWWPPDYDGKPLVSFASDVAAGLGLSVGDTIAVNVLGRRIVATIANLRDVRWQRLSINFVMVFSPNTFKGAPYTYLSTLTLPGNADVTAEITLARKIAQAFPAVSSVRVKEVVAAVDGIVSQLALGVRAASGLALLASVLVLGGALGATARARQHDSVILKTLGASRRVLLATILIEYALLGCIAVVFALVCGTLGARFVVMNLMNFEFTMPWMNVLSITLTALLATITLGLMGTWHILGQKPAAYLRHA